MEIPSNWVRCDGCGLPASPAHIAERVNRLELATRYRPIHISVLFLAGAPLPRLSDDFYRPPESRDLFDSFMTAVGIPSDDPAVGLNEFQHRGYYLSYLSECPINAGDDPIAEVISRLGPAIVTRVRHNYKPKQIAILGGALSPLLGLLENAGMPAASVSILEMPVPGDTAQAARFRSAFTGLAMGGSGSD